MKFIKKEANIVPVPGIWISAEEIIPPEDANLQNASLVAQLLKPQKLPNENQNKFVIIPVMPAIPPKFINKNRPIQISAPLKGSKSPYSNTFSKCFQSGARSAIIPCRKINNSISDEWIIASDSKTGFSYIPDFENGKILIRLKGCGMWLPENDIPFPSITLKPINSQWAENEQNVFNIRGVSYTNQSLTELYVNNIIETNLAKLNLLSANSSLGFWMYKNLQNDETPNIQKTVSIFLTRSEKRLQPHLLPGLMRLINKKFDENLCQKVIDSILPLYGNSHQNLPSRTNQTVTRTMELNLSSFKTLIPSLYNNFDNIDIDELRPETVREAGFIPTNEIYSNLSHLGNDLVSFLKIHGRIGFEAGKILSIVHRSGFSWGTYADHDPCELHCNSHSNNLAILSKEDAIHNKTNGNYQILSPLDFDMAFSKEKAVNFYQNPAVPDPTYATNQFFFEFQSLLNTITYCFTSFVNLPIVKDETEDVKDHFLWLCRECIAYEFIYGYQHINEYSYPENDISVDCAYEIINEAMNEMNDM